MSDKKPPLLAISGYSGTGKTTLLKQVIPLLNQRGVNVAVIKHSHHDVDIDIPGKDSYELRKSGARQTILAGDRRWALITETPDLKPVNLYDLIDQLDSTKIDIVIVEGFKDEPISKIILFREDVGKPFDNIIDPHVIALASNKKYNVNVPQLDINNPNTVTEFIINWLNKNNN